MPRKPTPITLAALLLTTPAAAQPQSQPESQPGAQTDTPSTEPPTRAQTAAEKGAERARSADPGVPATDSVAAPPVTPRPPGTAEPPQPGITSGIDWLAGLAGLELDVPQPTLLAERTFLSSRAGEIIRGPSDTLIFIPSAEAEDPRPGEGPMLLMPSGELARVEAAMGKTEDRIPFTVTGEIFIYADRNYLLLAAASRVLEAEPEDKPAEQTDDQPDVFNQDDPRVTELISELERRSQTGGQNDQLRGGRNNALRGAGRRPGNTGEAVAALINEGTLIFQRRGRVARDRAGRVLIRFDNDLDSTSADATLDEGASADHELIVLPCRLLESLEDDTEFDASPTPVLISGRVYAYDGENYIMPTMYQLTRYSEIVPGQ